MPIESRYPIPLTAPEPNPGDHITVPAPEPNPGDYITLPAPVAHPDPGLEPTKFDPALPEDKLPLHKTQTLLNDINDRGSRQPSMMWTYGVEPAEAPELDSESE